MKIIVLLLFFIFSACSNSAFHNNFGLFKMYMNRPIEAKTEFTAALLTSPGHALARYNLSMSNLQLEQLKDSLQELDALEELYEKDGRFSQSKELFQVYFAKGFLLGLIQNVEGALASYQKALSVDPKSMDVKNNIEILTAKGAGSKSGDSDRKKKGKKGEGKSGDKGDQQEDQEGTDKNKDTQGRDDSSLKKKNLSKEEIEQILKEIKEQESRVRAKENKNNGARVSDEKSW